MKNSFTAADQGANFSSRIAQKFTEKSLLRNKAFRSSNDTVVLDFENAKVLVTDHEGRPPVLRKHSVSPFFLSLSET